MIILLAHNIYLICIAFFFILIIHERMISLSFFIALEFYLSREDQNQRMNFKGISKCILEHHHVQWISYIRPIVYIQWIKPLLIWCAVTALMLWPTHSASAFNHLLFFNRPGILSSLCDTGFISQFMAAILLLDWKSNFQCIIQTCEWCSSHDECRGKAILNLRAVESVCIWSYSCDIPTCSSITML